MCTGYHREVLTRHKEAMAEDQEEQHSTVLRELCAINGVSYDHLERGSGHKVTKLESFFFGTPCIPQGGLVYFPALTELRIVNQKFTHISGLDSCVGLTQLWICEGQLECIEGLSACTNLTSLYLYTNRITKIGGLDTLTKLRTLWLNGNLIPTIQGLDSQCGLQELNLAHNKIPFIGTSLDHLTGLIELNLSGNLLCCLSDLVHLSSLPHLSTLSLCDPLYTPNPVATLCNYSTHVLYHLPTLHWLDGVGVASEELHLLVEGVVQRKKRFYRMKTHHIQMEAREKERRIREQTEAAKNDMYSNIREVQRQIKTSTPVDPEHLSSLTATMEALDTHLTRLERVCCVQCERVWGRSQQLCQRWSTELESGGNVKFLAGGPTDPWVTSCEEIVQSRLTVTQGVSGVEVTGVIKVENRFQYTRFNDKLKLELEKEVFSSLSSWKSLLDYLFIVWQPGMTCLDLCGDKSSSAHVTNSVNLADALRIADLAKGQGSPDGELLLCKVFVGLSSQVKTNKVLCLGDDVNTVCRLGEGGQKEWFLADSDLLLPEYILSVRYKTPAVVASEGPPVVIPGGPTHPRLAMLDESTLLASAGADTLTSVKELCFHDNHLTRFRLASSLPCLVKLVLSCNEIGTAEDLRNMPCLEELDISFNSLSSLDGLKGVPKLNRLDVRGNLLASGQQVMTVLRKHTPSLQSLDIRYNPWDKVPCDRVQLLGHLKTLGVFNGSTVSEEEARGALKQVVNSHLSLSTLMSHAHTHTHTPHTLTLHPLSQVLHTDTRHRACHQDNWTHTVTSLCLDGLGLQHLHTLEGLPNLRWCSLANNSLTSTSIEVVMGCSGLEELILDGNHLHDLPSLHTLTHLTHLSLADNLLSSLPPLFPQLAYLNVSYNKLSTLGPLKYCVSLVELYASGNTMATTRQLFPLKALTSLAICDLSANPVTLRSEYRHFIIYHCSSLKALDGTAIEGSEVVAARERMGGRLCQDLIFERHHDTELSALRQLDVTHAGVKIVDLSPVSVFNNLASLNLEHNSLTSFSGLIHLHCLKVLCLNHNRVEALVSSREAPLVNETVLTSLQVLHLAYNGIRNLSALQLGKIPSLRALFLQGNEISTVDGLDGLHQLTELVLDRNKVKVLQARSFVSLSALRELHIEENRLKDLSHMTPLVNLQRLYLGMNKIQDFNQLEILSPLHRLVELSLVSNPVSRRLQHRGVLVYLLPSLLSLDGVQVSPEERTAAYHTFTHSQQETEAATVDSGLSHGSLLKVMNVPFGHQTTKPSAPAFTERRRGK